MRLLAATRFCGGLTLLLLAMGASGCEKLKEDRQARQVEHQREVEGEAERLSFMLKALSELGDEAIDCRDEDLASKLKRSARACTRLALTDEANLRAVFGDADRDDRAEQWSWMRTRSFDTLVDQKQIGAEVPLAQQRRALNDLKTTFVGVFTTSSESKQRDPERYQGWLVIFDTESEKLRCQVELDLDVEKIFKPPSRRKGADELKTSPKPHIDQFMRDVDKELRSVTKNFCTE